MGDNLDACFVKYMLFNGVVELQLKGIQIRCPAIETQSQIVWPSTLCTPVLEIVQL